MIRKIRGYINLTLFFIKWPVAIVTLLAVPAVWQVFKRYYIIRSQLHWQNLGYFAVGLIFFLVARIVFTSRRGAAETMEHEMTHTLFALLTLHPVHGMSVEDHGGGSVRISGGGNWLIALAPYFFPLAAVGMILLCLFVHAITGGIPEWVYVGMGCAVAYNLFSLAQQVHPGQTDFRVAGYLFSICFLPGANMLVYGTIFAFVERGFPGIHFFYRLFWYYIEKDLGQFWGKITALF